jgi:hypothetical protein
MSRAEWQEHSLYRPQALEAWRRPRPEEPPLALVPPRSGLTAAMVVAAFAAAWWLLFAMPLPRWTTWPATLSKHGEGCVVQASVPRTYEGALAEAQGFRFLGEDGKAIAELRRRGPGAAVFDGPPDCLPAGGDGAAVKGWLEVRYRSAPLLSRDWSAAKGPH